MLTPEFQNKEIADEGGYSLVYVDQKLNTPNNRAHVTWQESHGAGGSRIQYMRDNTKGSWLSPVVIRTVGFGSQDAKYPSLVTVPNTEKAIVAYKYKGGAIGSVRYKEIDNGVVGSEVTVFTGTDYGYGHYTASALDSSDNLYIISTGDNTEGVELHDITLATVNNIVPVLGYNIVRDLKIVIDENDDQHVTFYSSTNNILYYQLNGGSIIAVGFPVGTYAGSTIVVRSGIPYVFFNDDQLKLVRGNGVGGFFAFYVIDGSSGSEDMSADIDNEGRINVLYRDGTDYLYTRDDGIWTPPNYEAPTVVGNTASFQRISTNSLVTYPHGGISFARQRSTFSSIHLNWGGYCPSFLDSAVDGVGDVGNDPRIVIDSSGVPHITYGEQGSGRWYIKGDGAGGWLARVQVNAGNAYQYADIALDSNDDPCIVYYLNASGGELHYATWNGSSFDDITINSDGDSSGIYCRLLIASGILHVVYIGTVAGSSKIQYITGNEDGTSLASPVNYATTTNNKELSMYFSPSGDFAVSSKTTNSNFPAWLPSTGLGGANRTTYTFPNGVGGSAIVVDSQDDVTVFYTANAGGNFRSLLSNFGYGQVASIGANNVTVLEDGSGGVASDADLDSNETPTGLTGVQNNLFYVSGKKYPLCVKIASGDTSANSNGSIAYNPSDGKMYIAYKSSVNLRLLITSAVGAPLSTLAYIRNITTTSAGIAVTPNQDCMAYTLVLLASDPAPDSFDVKAYGVSDVSDSVSLLEGIENSAGTLVAINLTEDSNFTAYIVLDGEGGLSPEPININFSTGEPPPPVPSGLVETITTGGFEFGL